jgi:hypothetical protein
MSMSRRHARRIASIYARVNIKMMRARRPCSPHVQQSTRREVTYLGVTVSDEGEEEGHTT